MLPYLIAAAIAAVFIVVMTLPRRSPVPIGATEVKPAEASFSFALRGWDSDSVDKVIESAQGALDLQDPAAAAQALEDIAQFRANPLIVLRGYDRDQVTAHLDRLSAELAGRAA